MKILFVDDEKALCSLALKIIPMGGNEVEAFVSPEQAYQEFASRPWEFHGLVTDFNMPGIDGLDLIAKVKALKADLPTILVSANLPQEVREVAEVMGVDNILEKPLSPTVLLEVLRSLGPQE